MKFLVSISFAVFFGMPMLANEVNSQSFSKQTARMNTLYVELMNFKDNPKFHFYGFTITSPYKNWEKDIQTLDKKKSFNDHLMTKCDYFDEQSYCSYYLPTYLYTLATEYIMNKGHDSDLTRDIRKSFEAIQ